MESVCKVVFPIVFLIFNIGYWPAILVGYFDGIWISRQKRTGPVGSWFSAPSSSSYLHLWPLTFEFPAKSIIARCLVLSGKRLISRSASDFFSPSSSSNSTLATGPQSWLAILTEFEFPAKSASAPSVFGSVLVVFFIFYTPRPRGHWQNLNFPPKASLSPVFFCPEKVSFEKRT